MSPSIKIKVILSLTAWAMAIASSLCAVAVCIALDALTGTRSSIGDFAFVVGIMALQRSFRISVSAEDARR